MYILIQLVDWRKADEVIAGRVLKLDLCPLTEVKEVLSKHMKDIAKIHGRWTAGYATNLMEPCTNLAGISLVLRVHTEWRAKFKLTDREGWYK
ncbi:hypothetical protein FK484_0084 [Listeria phage LP-031]|uniref:Uncharacterized protein n=1 Tax=Listeria phage LP-031 TaxID=2590049 RepID=A0A514U786_9CAUD|nr:hypothetical protein FK484_0084 [Listeria phage LP-031]